MLPTAAATSSSSMSTQQATAGPSGMAMPRIAPVATGDQQARQRRCRRGDQQALDIAARADDARSARARAVGHALGQRCVEHVAAAAAASRPAAASIGRLGAASAGSIGAPARGGASTTASGRPLAASIGQEWRAFLASTTSPSRAISRKRKPLALRDTVPAARTVARRRSSFGGARRSKSSRLGDDGQRVGQRILAGMQDRLRRRPAEARDVAQALQGMRGPRLVEQQRVCAGAAVPRASPCVQRGSDQRRRRGRQLRPRPSSEPVASSEAVSTARISPSAVTSRRPGRPCTRQRPAGDGRLPAISRIAQDRRVGFPARRSCAPSRLCAGGS